MTAMQLQQIDPATLLVDLNILSEAELGEDFLAGVHEYGVLLPIVAVHTDRGVRERMAAAGPRPGCRRATRSCRSW